MWLKKHNKRNMNEYDISKYKFNKLKKGIMYKNNLYTLSSIDKHSPIIYDSPEWGFPKGRRNLNESDFNCAIREFEEETGLKKDDYSVLDIPKINETFKGSNKITYRHTYYFAILNNSDIDIHKLKIHKSEVSNIGLYSYNEGLNLIRPYSREKKDILKEAHIIIKNHFKIV